MRGPPLVHLNLVYEMLVRSPLKAFPKHHQPQMYTFLGVTSDQCFDQTRRSLRLDVYV